MSSCKHISYSYLAPTTYLPNGYPLHLVCQPLGNAVTDQVAAVWNDAVERNRGHVPPARLVREAVRAALAERRRAEAPALAPAPTQEPTPDVDVDADAVLCAIAEATDSIQEASAAYEQLDATEEQKRMIAEQLDTLSDGMDELRKQM